MITEKPVINTISVKIDLTKQEKEQAKRYAKKHGYTFQWWLGSLVKEALKNDITKINNQIP